MLLRVLTSFMIFRGRIVLESLIGIRRAGAKLILTYYAEEALKKGWVR